MDKENKKILGQEGQQDLQILLDLLMTWQY